MSPTAVLFADVGSEFLKGEVGIGRFGTGVVVNQVIIGPFLGFLGQPDDYPDGNDDGGEDEQTSGEAAGQEASRKFLE